MKAILCVCLSITCTVEAISIESESAEYKGRCIELEGQVTIEHQLGVLSAEKMVLQSSPDKQRFVHMRMENQVAMQLQQGDELHCAAADLDCEKCVGICYTSPEQEFIQYKGYCEDKKGEKVPLEMKSREMTIEFSNRDDEAKNKVRALHACNDVSLVYHQDLHVAAEEAHYERQTGAGALPGTIVLHSPATGICRVWRGTQDQIIAEAITLHTVERILSFVQPAGSLLSTSQTGQTDRIAFSAETLTWEDDKGLLKLARNAIVCQENLGELTAEHEISVVRQKTNGDFQIQAIYSEGKTVFTHKDDVKELEHTLTCHGKVFVDHPVLKVMMSTPKDHQGCHIEEQQVLYEDDEGVIQANALQVDYRIEEKKIVPAKITLLGNVRLTGRGGLQYALADVVEYLPGTKEMVFKSLERQKRVLFFDKANNLQVSAPELRVTRQGNGQKEKIQGVGDVRFQFMESELELLQKRFIGKLPS